MKKLKSYSEFTGNLKVSENTIEKIEQIETDSEVPQDQDSMDDSKSDTSEKSI